MGIQPGMTPVDPGMTPRDLFILWVQPEMTQQCLSRVPFQDRDNPTSLYKTNSLNLNSSLELNKQHGENASMLRTGLNYISDYKNEGVL